MRAASLVILATATTLSLGLGQAAVIQIPADYPGLEDAVDHSAPGDTIAFADGTYSIDDVRLPHPLTLIGDPDDPSRVTLTSSAETDYAIDNYYFLESVRIAGITFRESGTVSLYGGTLVFSDCRFVECQRGAVSVIPFDVAFFERCVFEDNTSSGSGAAVRGGDCHAVWRFESCRFVRNATSWNGGAICSYCDPVEIIDCVFEGNTGNSGRGGALFAIAGVVSDPVVIRGSTFVDNGARLTGAVYVEVAGPVSIDQCSLSQNRGYVEDSAQIMIEGYGDLYPAEVEIARTIISGSNSVAIGDHEYTEVTLSCCNLFGNDGGDWVGDIADQIDLRGNFSADPCICDPHGTLTLCADSWCLPENHPWGCDELTGALGVGCEACDCGGPVAIEGNGGQQDELPDLPAGFSVYPNPFNPRTTIAFTLTHPEHVRLAVYDVAGRQVAVLADRLFESGRHATAWDGHDDQGRGVQSGAYMVVLETSVRVQRQKVVLLK